MKIRVRPTCSALFRNNNSTGSYRFTKKDNNSVLFLPKFQHLSQFLWFFCLRIEFWKQDIISIVYILHGHIHHITGAVSYHMYRCPVSIVDPGFVNWQDWGWRSLIRIDISYQLQCDLTRLMQVSIRILYPPPPQGFDTWTTSSLKHSSKLRQRYTSAQPRTWTRYHWLPEQMQRFFAILSPFLQVAAKTSTPFCSRMTVVYQFSPRSHFRPLVFLCLSERQNFDVFNSKINVYGFLSSTLDKVFF